MKRKGLVFVVLIVLLSTFFITAVKLYVVNAVDCRISDIEVINFDNTFLKGINEVSDEFILSQNEKKEIVLHPEKFRIIVITCDARSTLPLSIKDIKASARYNTELSDISIGRRISVSSSGDGPQIVIPSKGVAEIPIAFLVSADGKTDKQIIQYVKDSKFMVRGNIILFPFAFNLRQ